MKRKYRFIVLLFVALFTSGIGFSQNPLQDEPSQELEQEAIEYAERWGDELDLSAKQATLMEKKYIEFAMKKDELVNSGIQEEDKTSRLRELERLEYNDIRDILTKPQFDKYVALTQNPNNSKRQDSN